MKRAKESKAPQQRTKLDKIVKQLRTILRRETSDVVLAGNLLIESRKYLEHGEWGDWLVENFDMSYRTALNYVSAAEYVARKREQKCNVSHFTNLSASLLYQLAAGNYNEQEEAAIWAATSEGHVGVTRVYEICEALTPPPSPDSDDDDADDADDQEDGGEDSGEDAAEEDAETSAIIERGTDPAVPPSADAQPTDFALQDFNKAIDTLNRLKTKLPAQFAKTNHSADVLESVEAFIHAVTKARSEGAA
jgi:hypothetical protein